MFRWHVVSAVLRRNLKQYFTSVLGYLFIIVFVTLCSVLTFAPQFFADNLANLDQLSRYYPLLLLFIIPAITMNVWADEKRSGTDSILFTLPASDFEIVLGKYLAVVAVYTIALLFSASQLWFLSFMGDPDFGMVGTTYLGYWLAGIALLAIGMFASSLTSSVTVAFVLGTVFCAVPVLMGEYFRGSSLLESFDTIANNFQQAASGSAVGGESVAAESVAADAAESASASSGIATNSGAAEKWNLAENKSVGWLNVPLEKLGISWNLQDFTVGLIPLTNVVYFLSVAIFMFYLNMVVIGSRHWSGDRELGMKGHFFTRALFLAIGFIGLNYFVSSISAYTPSRIDLTAERLYSLTDTTTATIDRVRGEDESVVIQAFVSSEVPREYANVKKQLISTLRQFDLNGGNHIELRLVEVKPYSDHEAEARQLGIEPKTVESESDNKTISQKVYMGALVSSSKDDVVLPFIDSETSVEYELSHAIALTTNESFKISLGILDTDTHFSGPEVEGRRIDQWPVYQTASKLLGRQYDVTNYKMTELLDFVDDPTDASEMPEGSEKPESKTPPDVMFVPNVSSLDTSTMTALVKYVEAGNPTLILADPLPFFWPYQHPTQYALFHAPNIERLPPQHPFHDYLAASFFPKDDEGRAGQLLTALGIDWDNGTAVWSVDNPHPSFNGTWPPYLGDEWPEYYGPYDKALVWVRSSERELWNDGNENVDNGQERSETAESHSAFNVDSSISRGLKELLFFYPGSLKQRPDSKLNFQPLVTLGVESGTTPWEQLTMTPTRRVRQGTEIVETAASSQITNQDLIVVNPSPITMIDEDQHTIAARITGGDNNMDVVFISDMDFVSDLYVSHEEALESPLDNLALLQNAIDVLSGQEGFVALRNRRATPRTLKAIEAGNRILEASLEEKEQQAETEKQAEMAAFRARVQKESEKLQDDQTLSSREKTSQFIQQASDEARRMQIQEMKLDKKFADEVNEMKTEVRQRIALKESWYRGLAVLFAPLPAIVLGSIVLGYRWFREQSGVTKERKV